MFVCLHSSAQYHGAGGSAHEEVERLKGSAADSAAAAAAAADSAAETDMEIPDPVVADDGTAAAGATAEEESDDEDDDLADAVPIESKPSAAATVRRCCTLMVKRLR